MKDLSTGTRSGLLRIKRAGVVGIYHPLIEDKVVHILHGYVLGGFHPFFDLVHSFIHHLGSNVSGDSCQGQHSLQLYMPKSCHTVMLLLKLC